MNKFQLLIKQFPLLYALKFFLLRIAQRIFEKDARLSFSQTGEDVIINHLLSNISNGFYIEVGSNEPVQHSNTFSLYQNGWRGITIDANQRMVEMHRKIRINDIAICAAVSDTEKEVTFYEYEMDEISSIDDKFYEDHSHELKTIQKSTLQTRTLNSILEEKMPINVAIDLLSVDVEGHDYEVINSLDLSKFRPKLIVIEMHDFNFFDLSNSKIYKKLTDENYVFKGYAIWNGYFVSKEFNLESN